jgi:metal-responsive CopG/Arc/MetJ family transcriptional regulator
MASSKKRDQKITIRFTEQEKETLEKIARKNNTSRSDVIRSLIFTFIQLAREKDVKIYEGDQDIQAIKDSLDNISDRIQSLESRLVYDQYKQMIQKEVKLNVAK